MLRYQTNFSLCCRKYSCGKCLLILQQKVLYTYRWVSARKTYLQCISMLGPHSADVLAHCGARPSAHCLQSWIWYDSLCIEPLKLAGSSSVLKGFKHDFYKEPLAQQKRFLRSFTPDWYLMRRQISIILWLLRFWNTLQPSLVLYFCS